MVNSVFWTNFHIIKKPVNNDLSPFHATGLFLYPLETSENQGFSDDFRGYGKILVGFFIFPEGIERGQYLKWVKQINWERGSK